MNVEMLTTLATPAGPLMAGEVYATTMAYALEWIRVGVARETDREPPHVERLLARLDDGAGRECLYLPHVGEFGHLVMSHIRLVHFSRAARKTVCCRRGERALYPSADEFVEDWTDPIPDAEKVGSNRYTLPDWSALAARFPGLHPVIAGCLTLEQELYPIRPDVRIPFRPNRRGLRADVVLGVRRRDFCPERNWTHWGRLAAALTASGLTFAVVGAKPTSYDVPGQVCHSGDLDTDAALELLLNCRLYIGGDSGNSHLAAAVGSPMLLFREIRGGSRDLTPNMAGFNPGRVEVVRGGWDDPDRLIARALARLGAG